MKNKIKSPETLHYPDTVNTQKKGSAYQNVCAEDILKQVRGLIEKEKSYLNAGFSLIDLSKRLNLPTHLISYCINKGTKKSFPDLINQYRVGQAINMLTCPDYSDMSVEGIGSECGFGSPASFYRSFKKITGFTPTKFILKHEKGKGN